MKKDMACFELNQVMNEGEARETSEANDYTYLKNGKMCNV